eukprot:1145787-Pelagomonas_calceolata.AAC.2
MEILKVLAKPPFRGDARRALPQGASPMVWEFHTSAHTRPLWPTYTTSGSEIWNAPTKKLFRKPFKVWKAPGQAPMSNAPKIPKKFGSQPAAPCS